MLTQNYILIFLLLIYHSISGGNLNLFFIPDTSHVNNQDLGIEIPGMLVDETQSKIGQEFYQLFFQQWQPPELEIDYQILFNEKALPSLGSQITVIINDNIVFQQFVQPRYDKIEEAVSISLDYVNNYLNFYIQIQNELQQEDMKGTGIY